MARQSRSDIDKAQSMIKSLEAQRNQAFNQAVQMQVIIDDQAVEIEELKAAAVVEKVATKKDAK